MRKPPIRIETVSHGELTAFADRVAEDDTRFAVAPIIRLRAAALSRNPDADPAEPAMFVAYLGDRCAGYHGLLPGVLATDDGNHKVSWCSAFFVSPAERRQGIARMLLEQMIRTQSDIVVTGETDAAKGAYAASGATKLGTGRYDSVRPEKKLPKAIVNAAKAARKTANPMLSAMLQWPFDSMKQRLFRQALSGAEDTEPGVSIQEVKQIPDTFCLPPEKRPCFHRDARAVNWMLTDPWLISAEETLEAIRPLELSRYHFTGIRKRFRYHAFTLKSPRDRGFFIFNVSAGNRRTTVRLLDHRLPTAAFRRIAAYRLLKAGAEEKADRVDVPQEMAYEFQGLPALAPMVKRKKRSYWIVSAAPHGPLARAEGKLHFELHDGEQAFT